MEDLTTNKKSRINEARATDRKEDALAGIRTRVASVTGSYAGPLHYQGICAIYYAQSIKKL